MTIASIRGRSLKVASILQAFYHHSRADERKEAEGNRIQGIKAQTLGQMGQTAGGFNQTATVTQSEYWIQYIENRMLGPSMEKAHILLFSPSGITDKVPVVFDQRFIVC